MSLVFTQAQKTISSIRNMLPRLVTGGVVIHGEPIIYTEPENVPPVLDFLKMHTGTRCKQLVDITAVDYPTREKRFEVPPYDSPPHSTLPTLPLLYTHTLT